MLALREEERCLVVECIEVKTTKGSPRLATDSEIVHACEQLIATLTAVREGLGDMTVAEQSGHFLAAPRNEMLKEVFVQGCMGWSVSGEQRERWANWLSRLFDSTPELPELRATVVDVAFGSPDCQHRFHHKRRLDGSC